MAKIRQASDNPVLAIGKTNSINDSEVEVTLPTTIVHVFFDGTRNNRFNTEAARLDEVLRSKDVSYDNYFSNIALLFMALEENESRKKIYIEGSGTAQGETDSTFGLGLAMGQTGRKSRINSAFLLLKESTKTLKAQDIIINVYGFSRGAAWARHFCEKLKQNSDWKLAKINFVGIYDTVSSDGFGHYNDVTPLGLDIGKTTHDINFIAHFTAQNDYRKHFPLTRIKQAVRDNIGFECSFPGAHSDIGGGYPETYAEIDTFLGYVDEEKNLADDEYIDTKWFIEKGYYKNEEIMIKDKSTFWGLFSDKAHFGSRMTEYHYQFILAEIMKEIAIKIAQYAALPNQITDLDNDIEKMHEIPLLKKFRDSALNYVMNNYAKKGSGYVVPELSKDEMEQIYHRYIHNSLCYGDLANGGTKESKAKDSSAALLFSQPQRPEVTTGYMND